jgi:hypothetical protein
MTDRPRLHCAASFSFSPPGRGTAEGGCPHTGNLRIRTLLDLNRTLRGGDTSEQVFLFFPAFGANGEGIEDAQR